MSTLSRMGRAVVALAAATVVPLAIATSASAGAPETIMTMTAEDGDTARLGKHITVAFNDGYTIEGTHFDIWICDDTSVRPVDGEYDGETCQPLTFWGRNGVTGYDQQTTARTMSWLLTTDASTPGLLSPGGASYQGSSGPLPMETPEGGWCAYAGRYLITHDFDTADYSHGGHSNFLQIASDCDVVLPETGSSTVPFVATAVALLMGGAFVSIRRFHTA